MGEVTFQLLANFAGHVAFQVVSEPRHELVAGNHKPILLALDAK